jgi:hypothetical protein
MKLGKLSVVTWVLCAFAFSSCFAGGAAAETNDEQTIVTNNLNDYKRTGDYSYLLKAYDAIHVDSNSQASLEVKLNLLQLAYQARDWAYDLNADHHIFLNVMPPLVPPDGFVASGMDPEDIKDPVARKAYEDAIAENDRREAKDWRERKL